ncbi:MAG TPA: sensor histidine kinase [Ornithinicoccus sp.]|nr:sensor histidine kinase [Ornithinicoccus sp.]
MTESVASGHAALDRSAGVAGLLAYAMIGLLVVLVGDDLTPAWWAVWAVGLPLYAIALLVDLPRRTALTLLVPMALVAAAIVVLEPGYGFGAVPMVIVAACAGLMMPLGPALGVVAAQSLVLLWAGLTQTRDGLVTVVFYGALQVFAVMTGQIARREAAAGQALAAANADLRRTHDELRSAMTALEQAHAELEDAQLRLAQTSRADERLRISRDLHDLVGHQLSALAVNLEAAAHLVDDRAREPVEQARRLAKELLADVRRVVGQLREPDAELRLALQDMAAAIPRPAVHLTVADDLPDLDDETSEAVVRCVQEILTNAVRHAQAENVWVDVTSPAGGLVVAARDDGRGSDRVVPGYGLTGMRERVHALGGQLEFDGSHGFRVRVVLP